MEKRIFTEETVEKDEKHQPKQEFSNADIQLDEEPKAVEAELIIEESLKPSRFWLRLFLAALALFGVATIAQSVQWLIDTWQANQWIYFAFAVAFLVSAWQVSGLLSTNGGSCVGCVNIIIINK